MKVLHVVNSLDPGGMENGVVNIAVGLASRGFDTRVACLERCGAFAERLPEPNAVQVLGKSSGFSKMAAWRLARHISALQPDVVHSHNLGPLIYSAIATLGGQRVPLLHGEHSQLTENELTPRRLRQRHLLYRSCDAVHGVSYGIRDELLSLGFPASKISVITNGVDCARFQPAVRADSRRALDIPSDALCIGLVGRFGAFKRHDTLLAAFEQIADRFPHAHLLFVGGGGPEESRIADCVAASPFRARIRLAGFQADPLPYYQSLDFLAIPSTNEGLSNAALEAMACGVPALANIGCGHEQIITSGIDGIIADLHTPEALAAELTSLLSSPARLIDIGSNARRKIVAHFSLERMLAAYEQQYRALRRY